ncbi:MAG: ATP-dependent sacrificial sulfur transferase LarE [Brevinematia bacterium]
MRGKEKLQSLEKFLKSLNRIAIAFSGGLDSSFLTYFSKKILGKENVLALTVYSPLKLSAEELEESKKIASEIDVNHKIVKFDILEEIRFNPFDRCYLCKKRIFTDLLKIAEENGFTYLCEGTNVDDLADYRPGLKAIKELNVKSPFLEAGITKGDIRYFARKFKLSFWNKPSNACLISRLPYNTEISYELIERIARAESYIKKLGFKIVRVRAHNELARIEIGENEIRKVLKKEILKKIDRELKNIGFKYVSLDCSGYKMGSMNG